MRILARLSKLAGSGTLQLKLARSLFAEILLEFENESHELIAMTRIAMTFLPIWARTIVEKRHAWLKIRDLFQIPCMSSLAGLDFTNRETRADILSLRWMSSLAGCMDAPATKFAVSFGCHGMISDDIVFEVGRLTISLLPPLFCDIY